jgi:hypothetical protein
MYCGCITEETVAVILAYCPTSWRRSGDCNCPPNDVGIIVLPPAGGDEVGCGKLIETVLQSFLIYSRLYLWLDNIAITKNSSCRY